VRSAGQEAADTALTEAIEAVLRAYGLLEQGELTEEYIVVVATQRMDGDGGIEHACSTVLRNNDVSATRAVGLLAMAKARIYTDQDDE
jgi:hypothetical protein